MLIGGRDHKRRFGAQMPLGFRQRILLLLHQRADTLRAHIQQRIQFRLREGASLARALQLNELALFVHDDVHIHLRAAVFLIAQIDAGRIIHHADGNCRDLMRNRRAQELALVQQLADRAHERHHCAGNRRGARSAVGLQHVAVQRDGTFAQRRQINRLTQAASNQPGNLHAASVPLHAVALLAPSCRGGQHGIFRRHPALPLSAQERRHILLHRCCADNLCIARANQARAIRRAHKVGFNRHRAPHFRRPAIVSSQHISFPPLFCTFSAFIRRAACFSCRNFRENR